MRIEKPESLVEPTAINQKASLSCMRHRATSSPRPSTTTTRTPVSSHR
jgi:hypothetical protein